MGDNKVILRMTRLASPLLLRCLFQVSFPVRFNGAKDMSLLPKIQVVVDAGKERRGLVWRKRLKFRPVILS